MAKRLPANERRLQILRAACELFAERGVRGATVRDIGERAGVLSGSLYHHFRTKQEIVHELMRGYGEALLLRYRNAEARGGSARDKLAHLFHACLRANLEHASEMKVLIRELDDTFRQAEFVYVHDTLAEIEALFAKVIVQGISAGEIRSDVDPHFVYRMMMDVMGAVPRWFDPARHRADQIVEGWLDVFLRGIGDPSRV